MTSLRSPVYQEFLVRLRQARTEAQLPQERVAMLLGRPPSFVAKCELGQRRVDALELAAFANVYQKPVSYFIPSFAHPEDLLK